MQTIEQIDLETTVTFDEETQIIYPYMVAKEFPSIHQDDLIERKNVIDTIERMFNETSVVFLEGEEGCGATTTLAQFCEQIPQHTFCLFIKPASKITYSIEYLRLVLAEQFSLFLGSTPLNKDVISPQEYNTLLYKIRRRASKKNNIFFVIDGLQKIPPEENAVSLIFKEVLPLGLDDIRFLISGEQAKLEKFLAGTPSKYFKQLKFSLSESSTFMSPVTTDEDEIKNIYTLCDGLPGRLASVRRLLKNGTLLADILDSDPSKFLSFIRLEFDPVENLTSQAKHLLSVITFSNRKLTKSELLKISRIEDCTVLNELLNSCRFLTSSDVEDTVEFVSDAHRRFSCTLIAPMRNSALGAHIEFLMGDPSSNAALTYLPTYYQQLDQTKELIRLLTSEHFTQLLDATESLGSLRARAELGIRSAVSLKQATDVFAFSVKRSIFSSIANAEGSNSQIKALVALGDHQSALEIAYKSIANEERLAFLSAYAKQCKESTKTVDENILTYIKDTAKKIDFSSLGETAIDLASEIVHVDPDLAMSIVDVALEGNGEKNKDQAFARLSLETVLSQRGKESKTISDATSKRISDEKLQVFLSSILTLVSTYSADEVIRVCASIEPNRRLHFLGYWMQQHKTRPEAISVAEHGLDLMIGNATYSPKMRDFSSLASALPFSDDLEKVEKLVDRFDSQRGIIKDSSASTDLVLLQMTLAHAEKRFNIEKCASRVIECYYELSALDDNDAKLNGFSITLQSLYDIDKSDELESQHGFKYLIKNEISSLLNKVLEHSADHFLISKGVIHAFSNGDFSAAMEVAASLNTEDRRDSAFAEIIRSMQNDPLDEAKIDKIFLVLNHIADPLTRDRVFCNLLRNASTRKNSFSENSLLLIERYIEELSAVALKARALIDAIRIRVNSELPLNEEVTQLLFSHMKLLDSSFDQSSLAFDACSAVAKINIDEARKFYNVGIAEQPEDKLASHAFSKLLASCLGLTSRAFGGGMQAKCFEEQLLPRFLRLADLLPSNYIKIDVLSDIAARAWISGRSDISISIIESIISIIDGVSRSNPILGKALSMLAFPVLYCCRSQVALDYARRLNSYELGSVVSNTLDLLVRKSPASDPDANDRRERAPFSYLEAKEACQLIELLRDDNEIYIAISDLVAAICCKRNTLQFTNNQRADIASRLETYYRSKLPDPLNIKHDGYLILCDANMEQLRGSTEHKIWKPLVDQASAIHNLADRGFVLTEIAGLLPSKLGQLRTELQKQASDVFAQVPSITDKINRLIGLSDRTTRSGIALAKQSLKSALIMTLQTDNEEHATKSRQRIIDIAEKIDSAFADELSDLIDNDPAREYARAEVKDRIKMLAVKKKISNSKETNDISNAEIQHLPEAAWKNVSGLISGRVETKSPELLMSYLHRSSHLAMESAFPVLSWFIENSTKKYEFVKESNQIASLSESLLLTTELAANVMLKVAANCRELNQFTLADNEHSMMLGINNRVEAIRFIAEWLSMCKEEIILCDPYFGSNENDLEFLKLVLGNCPQCDITILTSKKLIVEQGIQSEELFLAKWNLISDQYPPSTRIIGTAIGEGTKCIIHDRWLICGERGLRLGTSFNGIGTGKLSEISRLNDTEIIITTQELRKFIANERTISGARVSYLTFTI